MIHPAIAALNFTSILPPCTKPLGKSSISEIKKKDPADIDNIIALASCVEPPLKPQYNVNTITQGQPLELSQMSAASGTV